MKKITEEDDLQEGWYERAKRISNKKELLDFIKELTTKYEYDYGTICHAIAAAAIAAAYCVENSPQGGITGFQAGAVMWQFIKIWNSGGEYDKDPLRIIDYGDLLFPQYEDKFTQISKKTWDWVQKQAIEKLEEKSSIPVHPSVLAHWYSIKNGIVPFGLNVKSEDK
jgi:hypothetical protein